MCDGVYLGGDPKPPSFSRPWEKEKVEVEGEEDSREEERKGGMEILFFVFNELPRLSSLVESEKSKDESTCVADPKLR